MTVVSEPITHDITVYQGTDHEWLFRRIAAESNEPIIPDSVRAQIRNKPNGTVWCDLGISIDEIGWIRVLLPLEITSDPIWYARTSGVWDLEAVLDGKTYRWVMGTVTVSQEVTDE